MSNLEDIIKAKNLAKNPGLAIMEAIKEMKRVIEETNKEMMVKHKKDIEAAVKAAENNLLVSIDKKLPGINELIERLRGEPGDDASPEEVAKSLLKNKEFLKAVKPENGKTPSRGELLAIITPLIPVVQHGKTPTNKELLKLIRPLIPKKAKDGETPSDVRLLALIKRLMPKIRAFVPETPRQTALKLNETEGLVEQKVIKNLLRDLDVLRRAIRQKGGGKSSGGGMGNLEHENTATSSATTTVSTTQRIAANGDALWLYYNGQFMMKGTHYTVGGDQKTITFLISLQDDTNVSILYIRT